MPITIRFHLSGAYVMAPGDINHPPYDAFDHRDIDWNCNGALDDTNPYAFPLYRSVTLIGRLTRGSQDGHRIEGDYHEAVYGLLQTPIRLQGTFAINRAQYRPFTSRQAVANLEAPAGTDPVVIKEASPNRLLGPGSTVIESLSIHTDLALHHLEVGVDIAPELPAADLVLSLRAPSGLTVRLHDRAPLSSMRNVLYPTLRTPVESIDPMVDADDRTAGDWQLIIENRGPHSGRLHRWSLRLEGQAVFDITGVVRTQGSDHPLPADLSLEGMPYAQRTTADANGQFTFARVPGIPLNFLAQLTGYTSPDPAQPGLSSDYTLPTPAKECLSAEANERASHFQPLPAMPVPAKGTDGFDGNLGTPDNPVVLHLKPQEDLMDEARLIATPPVGPAPLTVRFTLVDPDEEFDVTDTLYWDFGDGHETISNGLFTTFHTFAHVNTNGYETTVEGPGGERYSIVVYVMPSPSHTPYAWNFFQPNFTGGGSLLARRRSPSPCPIGPT